jgi:plasmid maintenance system antidote protein VapI
MAPNSWMNLQGAYDLDLARLLKTRPWPGAALQDQFVAS